MKKIYWIFGIVLVLLVATGIFSYTLKQEPAVNNSLVQECSNYSGFCMYNNIPAGMLYSNPKETLLVNLSLDRQATINKYFKRTASEGLELHEAFGLDLEKYVCSDGSKIVIVKYFYDLCEGYEGLAGCGYERKAIICGNTYFIEQYSDTTGPLLFGPFNK